MPAVGCLCCSTSPSAAPIQAAISTVVASMQAPQRSSAHFPAAARSPHKLTGLRSSIHFPVAAHRPEEPTQAQDADAGRIQLLERLLCEKQAALDDLQRRSASQQGVFAEQKVRSSSAAMRQCSLQVVAARQQAMLFRTIVSTAHLNSMVCWMQETLSILETQRKTAIEKLQQARARRRQYH